MYLHNTRYPVAVQRDGASRLPEYTHYNILGMHLSNFYSSAQNNPKNDIEH